MDEPFVPAQHQQNQDVIQQSIQQENSQQIVIQEVKKVSKGWGPQSGFQKGHPIYPGQGKHGPYMRTRLKEILKRSLSPKQIELLKAKTKFADGSVSIGDAILARVCNTAVFSKNDIAAKAATEFITEQCDGKLLQKVEQTSLNVDGNLDDLSDDQLNEQLQLIETRLAEAKGEAT